MRATRAAIYARYSSDEQTGGESIDYQLERCRDYITGQGWSLPAENVFVDQAKSGTSTYRRDAFNRMIAQAKQKDRPFDVVVAWSTSRFGRNQDEAIFNKIGLKRQGVDVKFVSQPVPDGHMGTLIERIYEWKDEFDSIQIGQYAFEGQKQVTQKGYHGGGKAPYGYKRVRVPDPGGKTDKDGKVVEYVTYEVVPEQADVVRRVFRLYGDGQSYLKIANALNLEGQVSPGGSTWDVSSVRTILRNESYLGRRVWNQTRRNKKVKRGTKVAKPRDEWIVTEGAHPAIIDKDLWQAAQAIIQRNARMAKGRHGYYNTPHSPHLLTGIVRCDCCGSNYHLNTVRWKRKVRQYYRCGHHSKRGNAACANGRGLRREEVETAVLDLISQRILTTDMVDRLLEAVNDQIRATDPPRATEDIEAAIRKAEREAQNLTTAIKVGRSIERLVRELNACEVRKAELEEQARELQRQDSGQIVEVDRDWVEKALSDLRNTLAYNPPEERKPIVQEYIREIRVPEKGPARLETNPTGLLSSLGVCELLVTPRGVHRNATRRRRIYKLAG